MMEAVRTIILRAFNLLSKVVHVKQMQREVLAEGWPVYKYLMLPGQDLPIYYR